MRREKIARVFLSNSFYLVIGMEVASALISVASRVTVISMDEVPFQLQLGERVGRFLRKWHESRGVRLEG